MTRKDYVAVAAAIQKAVQGRGYATLSDLDKPRTGRERAVVASVAREIGYAFKTDNPRFDMARFLDACDLAEA